MTRLVHWSRDALNDIKSQIIHIAKDSEEAATRIADRIREVGSTLGLRATGRPGRVTGTYEKSVSGLPYIVAYALAKRAGLEVVVILRVVHTARNWPSEKWPQ